MFFVLNNAYHKNKKILLIVFFVLVFSVFYFLFSGSEVKKSTLSYYFDDFFLKDYTSNLLIGSSSIKKINSEKYLNCGHWVNRGIGNSVLSDLIFYLNVSPAKLSPKHIIIYAGENDIARQFSVEKTFNAYVSLINITKSKYPDSYIHILSIKLSPKRHEYHKDFLVLNGKLEKYAKSDGVIYFHKSFSDSTIHKSRSFVEDGIHLSPLGYYFFTLEFNKTCKTI